MAGGIRFTREAHARPGRFSVPMWVLHQLGLEHGGTIHLTVESNGFYWQGPIDLRSGAEVYAHRGERWTDGLREIQPKAILKVEARRPTSERAS